jgi:hypothetical protein
MATVPEQSAYFGFSKQSPVIKRQRRYRTQHGQDPPSGYPIRRGLKQLQETGSVVAAIEEGTRQMLENTWREIEYRFHILRAKKFEYVESYLTFFSTDSTSNKFLS